MAFTPNVTELNVQQQGGVVFPGVSGWNDVVVTTANTAASYNLAAARTAMGLLAGQPLFVVFSADGPFWANFNAAAAIPATSNTDGRASEFSPNQRYLDGNITAIGLISVAGQKISMQFFRP